MGKNEDEINLLDTNGDNYVSVLRYFCCCCCCWMNLVVVVNAFGSWNNAGRMGHFTLVAKSATKTMTILLLPI